MEGGLVGAEVNIDVFVGEPFPEIDNIALVGEGNGFLVLAGLAYSWYQFVQVIVDFVHPALVIAFAGSEGIDFSDNAHNSGDDSGLRLCSRHSAKSGGYEEHTCHIFPCWLYASGFQLLACGVHYRDGGSVDNALWADVHIGSGCHLSVLGYSEGIETLPVILL